MSGYIRKSFASVEKDTCRTDVSFSWLDFVNMGMTATSPLLRSTMESRLPTIEQTRQQFLASVEAMRPRLHRFCARMVGSALDGEDVVQESLAQAFESLPTLNDPSRLESWLFRIAHHKCVDFLRRERRRLEDTVPYRDEHDVPVPPDASPDDDAPIDEALVALVGDLPPKERASVLLKDVLDYRLDEIAAMIDSTVGGVKAALHRAREKLRAFSSAGVRRAGVTSRQLEVEQRRLLEAYADCFNRRDWEALGKLIQVDARLEIVGAATGTMLDVGRNYTSNYAKLPWEWRLSLARVDGEPVLVHWRRVDGRWKPVTAARLWCVDGKVARIRDYVHVDYLLEHAATTPLDEDRAASPPHRPMASP